MQRKLLSDAEIWSKRFKLFVNKTFYCFLQTLTDFRFVIVFGFLIQIKIYYSYFTYLDIN